MRVSRVAWISILGGDIAVGVVENDMKVKKGRILVYSPSTEENDMKRLAEYGTEIPLDIAIQICKEKGSMCDFKILN